MSFNKKDRKLSDTEATVAVSKIKIDVKKEGIKRNLVSSYGSEEKDTNKKTKESKSNEASDSTFMESHFFAQLIELVHMLSARSTC